MTSAASTDSDFRPLAVFDLDGTLVARDTFLPFLVSYALSRRLFRPLLTLPAYLLLYACRLLSDRAAKERVLVSFLRGRHKLDVAAHADLFSRTWVPPRLRADVVGKLREHQRAGHRVILLSASPDVYVPAIARELGITEVICTEVAGDADTWNGALAGPNCKGVAKLGRLCEYLGCDRPHAATYAYGDRPHDLAVLAGPRPATSSPGGAGWSEFRRSNCPIVGP
jgi:phosphatidylglycerophosphatase C